MTKHACLYKNGLIHLHDRVLLPDDRNDLKKLLTISHAGVESYRGVDATHDILVEEFKWSIMKHDSDDFVAHCLLRVMSRAGEKMPRPLTLTLYGTRTNVVLHFDLFLGESVSSENYVLVLKD